MADLCMHDVVRCTVCHDVERDDLPADSRPFVARFGGTCRGCGFDIEPGQTIRFVADRVFHVACTKETRRG